MIRSIRLENFRSIYRAEVRLGSFTIIIGANGSGKSNFVKALELFSSIPRLGVAETIRQNGGFSAILSNQKRQTKGAIVELGIELELPEPRSGLPKEHIPITVEHEIRLGRANTETARVLSEKLQFNQVLAISASLRSKFQEKDIPKNSSFSVAHIEGDKVAINMVPEFSEWADTYMDWLGFDGMTELSLKEAERLIHNFLKIDKQELKYASLVDPGLRSIVRLSAQGGMYNRILSSLKRYDFLLNELRSDQPAGAPLHLTSSGNNMPSVLRRISNNKTALESILTTLGSISPFLQKLRTNQLRTGKQYIEFVEEHVANVESWNSSDGVLRALAILLAVESHPKNSTLILEEPETNLHPWAIEPLISHIRNTIEAKNLQVIITTHSQQVLENAYPEEVLVTSRTKQEGTQFRTIKELLPHAQIMRGEVSELWVKGLLGGIPDYD